MIIKKKWASIFLRIIIQSFKNFRMIFFYLLVPIYNKLHAISHNNNGFNDYFGIHHDASINDQIIQPSHDTQIINLDTRSIFILNNSDVIINCSSLPSNSIKSKVFIYNNSNITFQNHCNFDLIEIYSNPSFTLLPNSKIDVKYLILHNFSYHFPFKSKNLFYSPKYLTMSKKKDYYENGTIECQNERFNIILCDDFFLAYCNNDIIADINYDDISDLDYTFSIDCSVSFHIIGTIKSTSINSIMESIFPLIHFSNSKKITFYNFPELDDIVSFEKYLPSTGFEFWVYNDLDYRFDYESQAKNTKWRPVYIGLYNNSENVTEYFHYTSHSENDGEVINLSFGASLAIIIVLIVVFIGIIVSLGVITYCRFNDARKVSNEHSSMEGADS